MNLVRPFVTFSTVLLCACDKPPKISAGSSEAEGKVKHKVWSEAEREVARKVERKVGDKVEGIDVSKLEGWADLPSEGRAVVADFIREVRALDPEWLELQRAMNAANEPKQFVAALDRFSQAAAEWESECSRARANLRMVHGLPNAEEHLSLELQSKGPDLKAIGGKVAEVYERFSKDPEVQAAVQRWTSWRKALADLRSIS